MTAPNLYDRKYRLLLAHPIVGDFARAQPNALEITGLRLTFKVTKTLSKEPNTGEFTVSNLTQLNRQSINVKDMRVILEAGYADKIAGVFTGDARTIDHKRDGASWATTIKCGEGERAGSLARMNISFKTGTPLDAILDKVTKSLNLSFDKSLFTGKQAVNGYAAHGPSIDILDRVVTSAGYEWSIQDGKLQILRPDQATTEEVVELSSATGLLDSPEHSSPDKKTGKILVKAKCLLQPRVRPGGRVKIVSEGVKGVLRVEKVTHSGDTHGGDWCTDFEASSEHP